jgi:LPXTG-site transpeptidase (sortase) family protein
MDYPGYIPAFDTSVLPQSLEIKNEVDFVANTLDSASKVVRRISFVIALISIVFLFISYGPSVWFWVRPVGAKADLKLSASMPVGFRTSKEPYVPILNAQLPDVNMVSIPSIGVDAQIHEAMYDNYEDALRKGVWRVPEFGTPFDQTKPVIFAAHRFGYLNWSNSFRHTNSFYNLPKVKVGDTVEIVWHQRKYTYEIYRITEADRIDDYSGDLILYTCKDLTSPVRIFVYGKLLRI